MIQEAVASGCRLAPACAMLDLSLRTYQRWQDDDAHGIADRRKGSRRVAPANKLSEQERAEILAVANSGEFASSPPSQIVPTLADRGQYLASESSMYRILREQAQQQHRGRPRSPASGS
ncbi:MAG: helix-turn-helix domain-containing protein [Massilia sp.]|nr:helix-turn-helix domain-containing protein [Massilia sp.]